jgi:hypothetical protein
MSIDAHIDIRMRPSIATPVVFQMASKLLAALSDGCTQRIQVIIRNNNPHCRPLAPAPNNPDKVAVCLMQDRAQVCIAITYMRSRAQQITDSPSLVPLPPNPKKTQQRATLSSRDEVLDYPSIAIPPSLILGTTPHREGIEENEILPRPASDVLLNVQFAIEIAPVFWFRQDANLELRELQTWGCKHRTQHCPRLSREFVEFELMLSRRSCAESPSVYNGRSAVPLEVCESGGPYRKRALRCPLNVV